MVQSYACLMMARQEVHRPPLDNTLDAAQMARHALRSCFLRRLPARPRDAVQGARSKGRQE
jgi:hypothetical protein